MSKVLVTGVSGCIGAWVARCLLDDGHVVVGADVSQHRDRVDLVLGPLVESPNLSLAQLDVCDHGALERLIGEGGFDAVIHLAALQLPFCKADPLRGALVNVVGTLNFLEVARKHPFRFVYASSTAVYGPSVGRAIEENENLVPDSLYGVFKRTDEEMARIYHADFGVSSAGLRPWIVYGPARDQGLTADLTLALFAAAKGEPYHIRFTGGVGMEHASEVARAFIKAAFKPLDGARVYTLGGPCVTVPEVIDLISRKTGSAAITCADTDLPIACETTDKAYQRDFGPFEYMGIEQGFDLTLELWRSRGLL